MKPAPFAYARAHSREEVDELLAGSGDEAKILAGGQSLIPILNMRLAAPRVLVDINGLQDETGLPQLDQDRVAFGPLVRQRGAEHWPPLEETVGLLADAVPHIAHPAIRSRGTVCGSVAHADPAAELPPVLVALDAVVHARSLGSKRDISARKFFAGHLENVLKPQEWVESVSIPIDPPGRGSAFFEFARRHGDYALCGVAAIADRFDDGYATSVTYLAMSAVPRRVELPRLTDTEIAGDALDAAIASVVDELEPEPDLHASVDYRRHLARELGAAAVRRAVEEAR